MGSYRSFTCSLPQDGLLKQQKASLAPLPLPHTLQGYVRSQKVQHLQSRLRTANHSSLFSLFHSSKYPPKSRSLPQIYPHFAFALRICLPTKSSTIHPSFLTPTYSSFPLFSLSIYSKYIHISALPVHNCLLLPLYENPLPFIPPTPHTNLFLLFSLLSLHLPQIYPRFPSACS